MADFGLRPNATKSWQPSDAHHATSKRQIVVKCPMCITVAIKSEYLSLYAFRAGRARTPNSGNRGSAFREVQEFLWTDKRSDRPPKV